MEARLTKSKAALRSRHPMQCTRPVSLQVQNQSRTHKKLPAAADTQDEARQESGDTAKHVEGVMHGMT